MQSFAGFTSDSHDLMDRVIASAIEKERENQSVTPSSPPVTLEISDQELPDSVQNLMHKVVGDGPPSPCQLDIEDDPPLSVITSQVVASGAADMTNQMHNSGIPVVPVAVQPVAVMSPPVPVQSLSANAHGDQIAPVANMGPPVPVPTVPVVNAFENVGMDTPCLDDSDSGESWDESSDEE